MQVGGRKQIGEEKATQAEVLIKGDGGFLVEFRLSAEEEH